MNEYRSRRETTLPSTILSSCEWQPWIAVMAVHGLIINLLFREIEEGRDCCMQVFSILIIITNKNRNDETVRLIRISYYCSVLCCFNTVRRLLIVHKRVKKWTSAVHILISFEQLHFSNPFSALCLCLTKEFLPVIKGRISHERKEWSILLRSEWVASRCRATHVIISVWPFTPYTLACVNSNSKSFISLWIAADPFRLCSSQGEKDDHPIREHDPTFGNAHHPAASKRPHDLSCIELSQCSSSGKYFWIQ